MADKYPDVSAQNIDIDQLSVMTIRTLAIDAIQKANSGHPGMPLGAAPMAHTLWTKHLKFDSSASDWPNRDRFILSAGHGSMLLYALLHLAGYGLDIEELKNFRQWDSRTPGHPEYGKTPGVETTTGPLGAGFACGVGMAIAETFLAATFNRPNYSLIDHFTFGIVGDGDLMEGISYEAASLAGHLGLGKLIYLYDDNHISIDGNTSLAFTEDVSARFSACNWQVITVPDGNDTAAIDAAIAAAKADTTRPSLIKVSTIIGYGSPHKAGSADSHGAPLGADEVKLTKEALGWPSDLFFAVPERVYAHYKAIASTGAASHHKWTKMRDEYSQKYPELAKQWEAAISGQLPTDWSEALPTFTSDEKIATRVASGKVLAALAPVLPNLLGGSADLSSSNNTYLKEFSAYQSHNRTGRNIHMGVREHAMGAVLNGLALHGGIIPYGGTFFVFADYMRPSIRLAALMNLPVVYVFTHDSIGLGEDGPTHQPTEQLSSLRAMSNLAVIRPSDANETVIAWRYALEHKDGPTALILSRQNLPVFDRDKEEGNQEKLGAAEGLLRGGYVLYDTCEKSSSTLEPRKNTSDLTTSTLPQVILIATGSEVEVAMQAAKILQADDVSVRVVAMPCWELFSAQEDSYKESVLPSQVKARVAVEAGSSFGWERFIGNCGRFVGVDSFGASAPASVLYDKFGVTAKNVAEQAKNLL